MSDVATDEQVAQAKRLCEAATPGPWVQGGKYTADTTYIYGVETEPGVHPFVCTAPSIGFKNASFIAASRSLIPSLVSRIEHDAKTIRGLEGIDGDLRAVAAERDTALRERDALREKVAAVEAITPSQGESAADDATGSQQRAFGYNRALETVRALLDTERKPT